MNVSHEQQLQECSVLETCKEPPSAASTKVREGDLLASTREALIQNNEDGQQHEQDPQHNPEEKSVGDKVAAGEAVLLEAGIERRGFYLDFV